MSWFSVNYYNSIKISYPLEDDDYTEIKIRFEWLDRNFIICCGLTKISDDVKKYFDTLRYRVARLLREIDDETIDEDKHLDELHKIAMMLAILETHVAESTYLLDEMHSPICEFKYDWYFYDDPEKFKNVCGEIITKIDDIFKVYDSD